MVEKEIDKKEELINQEKEIKEKKDKGNSENKKEDFSDILEDKKASLVGKSDKKVKSKKRIFGLNKKQNKQVLWAVILMIGILLIVLFVPYVVKNHFNKFRYIKLDFEKTQLGEIFFYSTKIPITKGDEVTGFYTMNFRNDPRKLEYVNMSIPQNLIGFEKNETVYISFNPGMQACDDNTIALMNLAGFLRDFGSLDIKSAVHNEPYATEDIPYITCENSPNNTVLWLNSGPQTKIKKTGKNCYQLEYNNCEILPVTEKFMLIVLEGYMSYFKRTD